MREEIPKKVRKALEELKISGVVSGYTTKIALGTAAFTCWDKNGKVVCVLTKGKNDSNWKLENRGK